jgi:hypothetical protein
MFIGREKFSVHLGEPCAIDCFCRFFLHECHPLISVLYGQLRRHNISGAKAKTIISRLAEHEQNTNLDPLLLLRCVARRQPPPAPVTDHCSRVEHRA